MFQLYLIIFYMWKQTQRYWPPQSHKLVSSGTGLESISSNSEFSQCFYIATAKSLQLCPTLYDPIDGSPPGSPVPGILQARTLEWVAISFSNA